MSGTAADFAAPGDWDGPPMMTPDALAWLRSPDGARLLAEADRLPADRLTRLSRLRRLTTPERAAAGMELLELRARAKAKFVRADAMFFTGEGLEQSTGEAVARYRAAQFPPGAAVLDACCGIGGDALALAAQGPVLAVDRSPVVAACARANAETFAGAIFPAARTRLQDGIARAETISRETPAVPARHSIYTLCADVTTLDLARLRAAGIEAAFFDPSRRAGNEAGGRRRVRASSDYAPPLDWLETLRAAFDFVAVKVSPAIDDDALRPYGASVEFISERGECKVAVLWFGRDIGRGTGAEAGTTGAIKTARAPSLGRAGANGENYCGTVLRPGQPPETLTAFAADAPPIVGPRAWLLEPDPAVIRAHLVPQVAALADAGQFDPQIAYLTTDTKLTTPFATAYRVLDWLPFHLKNVQARLRALNRSVAAIKRRGVPLDPMELRTRLTGADRSAGDTRPAVVVLTRFADKPVAILCEPPE